MNTEEDKENIVIAALILIILVLLCITCLSGCSLVSTGSNGEKKNSNTSTTTFVYTYDVAGKPVPAARVLENGKIKVQITDPDTQERRNTEIDAGGWILVRPAGRVN